MKQINLNTALLCLIVPALVYLDGSIKQLGDKFGEMKISVARIEQQLADTAKNAKNERYHENAQHPY